MGKYLLKRILYSLLSLVAVMFIMMILLFQLKDSNCIFNNDSVYTKKTGNEKEYYKAGKLERFDYIDFVTFGDYVNKTYGNDASISKEELDDMLKVPDSVSDYEMAENAEIIKKFISEYKSKGYTIYTLEAQKTIKGTYKTGYRPYLYATKNNNAFARLWKFFSNLFYCESTSDVEKQMSSIGQNTIDSGYYLIGEFNHWNKFNNYYDASTFKLTEDTSKSVGNTKVYSLNMGVNDDKLTNSLMEYQVIYYNGNAFNTNLMEKASLSEKGEYTFSMSVTTVDGSSTYECTTEKINEEAQTELKIGGLYPCEKYVRCEYDPYSHNFAVVGSGTTHKYLLYFDNRFPFIHQNYIHMNLGTSYTGTTAGSSVESIFHEVQGTIVFNNLEYPAKIGTGEYESTSYDFHSATFNYSPNGLSDFEQERFNDRYTVCKSNKDGMSRIGYSFVFGIIATIISYFLGIPLGVLMARKKDKFADKLGMFYIIFIIAVPSLAYIFILRSLGKWVFNLPISFAEETSQKWLVYILPIISLVLPSLAGEMKWVRRYVIDQSNLDYVKFARSQGLSEGEIFSKHIAKNAIIPIVQGIPGAILSCVTGAYITEGLYGIPGAGNLMIQSINNTDNGLILGITFFYTVISIVSLILGDILLTIVDPRISFSSGGRK